MAKRLIVHTVISLGVMGALLFVSAGTLAWPAGWVFLAEMLGLSLLMGPRLARQHPGLVNERLRAPIQRDQPPADKVIVSLMLLTIVALLVLAPLDAVRFRWSSVPLWVQVLGALSLFLAVVLGYWTMYANSFAAPVVKIQKDRGQTVADTGPYSYVRHPMYGSALLFVVGLPLLLGSWWGLLAVPVFAALLAVRIGIEEQALRQGLAGYDAYTEQVPYRLVPLVW